jgi:acyl dehydratase
MRVPFGEYDMDAVRATWVGKSLGGSVGRYPVEYEPIRRHCHMVQDANPLYLDRDYAASGPYGAVVVPPAMLLMHFSSNGPWPRRPRASSGPRPPSFTSGVPTPGDRGINMSTSWKFLAPVVVGDELRNERAVRDVYMKPIKLDPHAVWIITEIRILNQRDELVAVGDNTVLVHRSPSQIAEDAKSEVGPLAN